MLIAPAGDEEISQLYGNHGRKDRADEVEEFREVQQGKEDGSCCPQQGDEKGNGFFTEPLRKGLAGNSCRIGIQESGGDGGEQDNQQSCCPQSCFEHDLGNIIATEGQG